MATFEFFLLLIISVPISEHDIISINSIGTLHELENDRPAFCGYMLRTIHVISSFERKRKEKDEEEDGEGGRKSRYRYFQ